MIALKAGGYALTVDPRIGASVAGLDFFGIPVLRRCAPGLEEPRESACYPLVPFANRIAHGILDVGGRTVRLRPNMGDHPHPLHGHGWLAGWRTVSQSAAALTLAFDHAGGEWPWAYGAEQRFVLGDDGLHIRLSVLNRAGDPMPVSLGLHPFFPCRAETVLKAKVGGVWLADATCIPTEHVPASALFDPSDGAMLAQVPFVDHCYSGWDGVVRIEQPDFGLATTMTASPDCGFLHCYIPAGSDFFAAEPVSAMPDAFNRPEAPAVTGARLLPPGETFAIDMHIVAERM